MTDEINKKSSKKVIFSVIVLVEFLLIAFLGYYLHIRAIKPKKLVLSAASFKKDGLICDPSVLPNYCEPIPSSVWTTDANSSVAPPVSYRIDSNGFNSDKNYSIEKNSSTYRIAAIGDSHTFGLYVQTDQNYPSVLEKYLNSQNLCGSYSNFEVLNLGFPGENAKYSTYHFEKVGRQYNPDLIIWYIKQDDFVEDTDSLIASAKECETKVTNGDEAAIKKCWMDAYDDFYNNPDAGVLENSNMEDSFKMIENFVKSIPNSKVLFFTYGNENAKILDFLNKLKDGNKNIYVESDLKYQDLPRFKNDEHPTVRGYEIVADALKNYLFTHILQCR